ncbi:hypothetical protein AAHH97_16055 [Mycolicibacterium elephantis]|uniref:hypothetical protein n=1 Tax=Mycolicibacterium elephantis TaxID=81858 RepID=UPI003A842F8E
MASPPAPPTPALPKTSPELPPSPPFPATTSPFSSVMLAPTPPAPPLPHRPALPPLPPLPLLTPATPAPPFPPLPKSSPPRPPFWPGPPSAPLPISRPPFSPGSVPLWNSVLKPVWNAELIASAAFWNAKLALMRPSVNGDLGALQLPPVAGAPSSPVAEAAQPNRSPGGLGITAVQSNRGVLALPDGATGDGGRYSVQPNITLLSGFS